MITGDLYDHRLLLDSAGSLAALAFVRRLATVCPVLIIRGTDLHDFDSLESLRGLPNVMVVSEARPDLDLCRSILSRARLAHFNIPDWARHLLSIARDLGLTIACDIQDVVDPDDAYRRDFVEQADILFFSATNRADPTDWMQGFMRRRPGQIVIAGMGGQGCAMGAAGEVRFFSPVDMDAPVVDTNGAGDSLAVGFLASYVLDGYSLEDAVLRGQIAARHACTLRGSSDGLITAEQMEVEFQARRG